MVYSDIEVPIPEGTHVTGNRVMITLRLLGRTVKTLVGMVSREGYMHPNQAYFQRIPEDKRVELPKGSPRPHSNRVSVGYLALTLAVGESTGFYPILLDTHGPKVANDLMDCCMEDLIAGSSLDPEEIQEILTFSLEPYQERWYRTVLDEADEEKNAAFRAAWFQHCLKLRIRKVCISADQIVLDGESVPGEAGSDAYRKILTVYWILAAEGKHRGLPITFFWTEDREIERETVEKLLAFCKGFGLQADTVLADQAFCTKTSLETLAALPADAFVQMAPESCGYRDMFAEYRRAVRENVRYALTGDYMFGTAVPGRKLVDASELKGTVAILYHSLQGAKQAADLVAAVRHAMEAGNRAITAGEAPAIPDAYKPFLTMEDGKLAIDFPALQLVYDVQGYRCICALSEKTADEIDAVFNLRLAAGKAFSALQRQVREEVPEEDGVYNRLFQCFLSAILRSAVERACKKARLEEEDAIADLNEVQYAYWGKQYHYQEEEPELAWALLEKCGVDEEQIRALQPLLDLLSDVEEGGKAEPAARWFTKPEKGKTKTAKDGELLYQGMPIGGSIQAMPDPSEQKEKLEKASKRKEPAPEEREEEPKPRAKRAPARPKTEKTLAKEEKMREYREACKAAGIELPEKLPVGRPKSIETLLREKQARERGDLNGDAD